MPEKEPGRGDPLGPRDWRKMFPFEQAAARDRPGWMGLGAAHYRPEPVFERNVPALTHHRLFLVIRPPEELDLRYEGVKRHVPPPAGAIMLVPAGSPAWARSSGYKDALHIFLEPGLVARVAAEAFGLDPARLTVPPLDGLDLPYLRAAMLAVDAELTTSGAGGRLAAEWLANVLAVHLIRYALAPRDHEFGRDRGGHGPRGGQAAVHRDSVEYLDLRPVPDDQSLDDVEAVQPRFGRGQLRQVPTPRWWRTPDALACIQ